MTYKRYTTRRALPKRSALVVALAVGMGISGLAFGQATTGSIFGQAPAGDTVEVTNNAGLSRTVVVPASGSYTFSNLPVGSYTVTLKANGAQVSSRNNVTARVGGGTAVNFASAQNAQNLSAVQVTANTLPAIDVTTVHDSTIVTAQQLRMLPIGRNATDIALLTPGTMASPAFNGLLSIGGSSVSENSYNINGYNTGEPYRNFGGFSLPYGAIEQQQTMTGGFSAKYGRADGGVINQIGKSGSNEWHFGGQVLWEPKYLAASPKNLNWPYEKLPSGSFTPPYTHGPNYKPGTLRAYRNDNKGWETIYTAYIGGPLIKDKLFFFIDAEQMKQSNTSITSITAPFETFSSDHRTKFYGKINWNINEDNTLEATFLQQNEKSGQGAIYNYDYDTKQATTFSAPNNQTTNDAKFEILKYTSFITDNATLSITYGKGSFHNPVSYGVSRDLPLITNGSSQNPTLWPTGTNINTGIINAQNTASLNSPDRAAKTNGLRVDFSYVVGEHTLSAGIDNMTYRGYSQGTSYSGGNAPPEVVSVNGAPTDGTRWVYIDQGPQATKDRYLVEYLNISNLGSMGVGQKAYYLQDNWQVTPNLLVNIGLRNDRFTNQTGDGATFVDEKNQWEPRLGASWDVFGDSSLKIYGNAGRYYLALPLNAANRAADASTYVDQVFTYTGIDPKTGVPTGLKAINDMSSPDGEYGGPKDVRQTVAQNLKAMYMDQYNLGFDAKLGDKWTYGAKLSYRQLKASIDDVCINAPNPGVIDSMKAMGLDPADYKTSFSNGSCRLFNPGRTNTFLMKSDTTGEYVAVKVPWSAWGFERGPVRKTEQVNLYFAHPFDGKWFGRVDYTYTNAKGNTVGQVRPDIAQNDVSKTEDWDYPSLMIGSYGELANVQKQVLRFRGAWQITPDWLLSGTAIIASGLPTDCLGALGSNADSDPAGYNLNMTRGSYHSCAGEIVHPGEKTVANPGHAPWTHQINVGIHWMPSFAQHRMTVGLDVLNALNEQKALAYNPNYITSLHQIDNTYGYPTNMETPRTIRLSVSYDY